MRVFWYLTRYTTAHKDSWEFLFFTKRILNLIFRHIYVQIINIYACIVNKEVLKK